MAEAGRRLSIHLSGDAIDGGGAAGWRALVRRIARREEGSDARHLPERRWRWRCHTLNRVLVLPRTTPGRPRQPIRRGGGVLGWRRFPLYNSKARRGVSSAVLADTAEHALDRLLVRPRTTPGRAHRPPRRGGGVWGGGARRRLSCGPGGARRGLRRSGELRA